MACAVIRPGNYSGLTLMLNVCDFNHKLVYVIGLTLNHLTKELQFELLDWTFSIKTLGNICSDNYIMNLCGINIGPAEC